MLILCVNFGIGKFGKWVRDRESADSPLSA